ncbi:hypothetical protein RA279_30520, partial [Pseudomonas syringae pv. tagetis]|uniref:hypothetical protein n=1 Tax=Pseudomonas syringae group genomosp. 7 TaxID=251699 RepID=UPI00376FD210
NGASARKVHVWKPSRLSMACCQHSRRMEECVSGDLSTGIDFQLGTNGGVNTRSTETLQGAEKNVLPVPRQPVYQ